MRGGEAAGGRGAWVPVLKGLARGAGRDASRGKGGRVDGEECYWGKKRRECLKGEVGRDGGGTIFGREWLGSMRRKRGRVCAAKWR